MALRSPVYRGFCGYQYRRRLYRRPSLYKVPQAFPDETGLVRHFYLHRFYISSIGPDGLGAGNHAYKWALNDLYDPDVYTVGAKASGFDSFSTIYSQYVVVVSHLQLSFRPFSSGTATWTNVYARPQAEPIEFSLVLTDTASMNPLHPDDYQKVQLSASTRTSTRSMGPVQMWGHNIGHLNIWYYPLSFWGQTWRELLQSLSGFEGAWTPTSRCICWFNLLGPINETDFGQWFIEAKLDFWAKWYNTDMTRPADSSPPDASM